MRWLRFGFAILGAALATAPAAPQSAPFQPPAHTTSSPLFADPSPTLIGLQADGGTQLERNRPPRWDLAEHRRLDKALAALQPQRKGVVDAYVVAVALDSDPVFGREAREAGRVLSRRYDAAGRTIVLAGTDGSTPSGLPRGSPDTLSIALARVAELMDRNEDVLILYSTSHGAAFGLSYHDGDQGYGLISPFRLWSVLNDLGLNNRLLILSACYSGVFVPLLSSDSSVVMTAASADRSSFGCQAENDWTFFGDALVNHELRKPQPLAAAFEQARTTVGKWEGDNRLTPSQPQISVGAGVGKWLVPLETRMPKVATTPVGRPATDAMRKVTAGR
jgi:hypothetical protein